MYTNPPTQESTLEGPNLLVGSRRSDWKLVQSQASNISPSLIPPAMYNATMQWNSMSCLGEYLRFHLLQCNRCTKTKKYGPNERTDQSSRKNTSKWWRASQPIRCRVQNTGNEDDHRNGYKIAISIFVWSQNRRKNEGYAKWKKQNI